MGLYDIKPRFRQLLLPVADSLLWLHPDVITLAGLMASGCAFLCIFYAVTRPWLLVLVPGFLFLRIGCNALDGLVAQRSGKARAFGEVLNEGADRIADVILILGLGITPWASFRLATATLVAVFLSSYAGILGKAVGVERQYGGILGKADRMFWMGAVALVAWKVGLQPIRVLNLKFLSVFDLMLAIFLPFSMITLYQRIRKIQMSLKKIRPPQ